MNRNAPDTSDQNDQLAQLELLLKRQIKSIKNGHIRNLEALIQQTDSVITEMTAEQLPQQPHLKIKLGELMQLYKKLELMVEAEKNSTQKQLRKVENGKLAVRAYHHKM